MIKYPGRRSLEENWSCGRTCGCLFESASSRCYSIVPTQIDCLSFLILRTRSNFFFFWTLSRDVLSSRSVDLRRERERNIHIYQILPIEHLNSVKAIILSFVERCCLPTPERRRRRRWLFKCKQDAAADDDDGDSTLEKTNLSSEDNQLPEMVSRRMKTPSVYSIVLPPRLSREDKYIYRFHFKSIYHHFKLMSIVFSSRKKRDASSQSIVFLLSQLVSGRVPRPPIYHCPHLISNERQWH